MRRASLGLSEVLGALVLVSLSIAAMLASVSVYSALTEKIESTGYAVVKRVEDESNPPMLSVSVENGSLYLIAYPQKPIHVKYIVFATNRTFDVYEVNKTIAGPAKLLLETNYTCDPFQAVLVTDSGALIRYTPLRDPRIKGLPGASQVMTRNGFIDACKILSMQGGEGSANPSTALAASWPGAVFDRNSGDAERLLVSSPPEIRVVKTFTPQLPGYKELLLVIEGSSDGGLLNLTYSLYYFDPYTLAKKLLGKASIEVQKGRGVEVAERKIADVWATSVEFSVYARAACAGSSCFAGLTFKSSNANYVYMGYVSYGNFNSDYYDTVCPFRNGEMAVILVESGLSASYSNSVNLCKSYNLYDKNYINILSYGYASGYFVTDGPLAVYYSNASVKKVEIKVRIRLYKIAEASVLNSPEIALPMKGPIQYWAVSAKLSGASEFERALQAILDNGKHTEAVLEVSLNGYRFEKRITNDKNVIPLANATYTIKLKGIPLTPITTIPSITRIARNSINTIVFNTYTLKSDYAPLDPRLMPKLVHVKSLVTGEKYLVALPATASPTLTQLGLNYTVIAQLIANMPAHIDPAPQTLQGQLQAKLYLVPLSGNLAAGVEYNLHSVVTVNVSNGTLSQVNEAGLYWLVAVPYLEYDFGSLSRGTALIKGYDPRLYESIIIVSY